MLLANTVFNDYLHPLAPYDAVLAQMRDPSSVYTYEQVARAGIQYVVAHEIGHALQAERAEPMTPIEAECDADTWAGVIAEHLGWDMTLQRYCSPDPYAGEMGVFACRSDRQRQVCWG
ncbi:MAG: hypothetical protein AB7S68_23835 [Polyangiaceae bacterium]